MIEVTHRPAPYGWQYRTDVGLDGGGRSLDACVETSEHAVRVYLSRKTGYDVQPQEARDLTRHVRPDGRPLGLTPA